MPRNIDTIQEELIRITFLLLCKFFELYLYLRTKKLICICAVWFILLAECLIKNFDWTFEGNKQRVNRMLVRTFRCGLSQVIDMNLNSLKLVKVDLTVSYKNNAQSKANQSNK